MSRMAESLTERLYSHTQRAAARRIVDKNFYELKKEEERMRKLRLKMKQIID
jgi:hypothetical protein